MKTSRTLGLTLALVTGMSAGCASVDSLARQATRSAVDEGAEELRSEDTQETLAKAADDPDLQAATTEMIQQVTEGVLAGLDSERAQEQITKLTRTAASEMIASLDSAPTRQQLVGLTSTVVDATLDQVAGSLQEDFRPALRAIIREDLAEGIAAALQSQELEPALGQAAQTVAYHAVLGANHGLGSAFRGSEGLLGEARAFTGNFEAPSMGWMLWLGLAVLAMLTLIAVSLAVMMIARARRTHNEVERLESATLLLATAMRERQQTQQSDEILAIVQQALEGRAERTGKHRILGAIGMRKAG